MTVSNADYLAFAEDIGIPYPASPGEKAQLLPLVTRWKADKAAEFVQQRGPSPTQTALLAGAGVLGLGGAFWAARKFFKDQGLDDGTAAQKAAEAVANRAWREEDGIEAAPGALVARQGLRNIRRRPEGHEQLRGKVAVYDDDGNPVMVPERNPATGEKVFGEDGQVSLRPLTVNTAASPDYNRRQGSDQAYQAGERRRDHERPWVGMSQVEFDAYMSGLSQQERRTIIREVAAAESQTPYGTKASVLPTSIDAQEREGVQKAAGKQGASSAERYRDPETAPRTEGGALVNPVYGGKSDLQALLEGAQLSGPSDRGAEIGNTTRWPIWDASAGALRPYGSLREEEQQRLRDPRDTSLTVAGPEVLMDLALAEERGIMDQLGGRDRAAVIKGLVREARKKGDKAALRRLQQIEPELFVNEAQGVARKHLEGLARQKKARGENPAGPGAFNEKEVENWYRNPDGTLTPYVGQGGARVRAGKEQQDMAVPRGAQRNWTDIESYPTDDVEAYGWELQRRPVRFRPDAKAGSADPYAILAGEKYVGNGWVLTPLEGREQSSHPGMSIEEVAENWLSSPDERYLADPGDKATKGMIEPVGPSMLPTGNPGIQKSDPTDNTVTVNWAGQPIKLQSSGFQAELGGNRAMAAGDYVTALAKEYRRRHGAAMPGQELIYNAKVAARQYGTDYRQVVNVLKHKAGIKPADAGSDYKAPRAQAFGGRGELRQIANMAGAGTTELEQLVRTGNLQKAAQVLMNPTTSALAGGYTGQAGGKREALSEVTTAIGAALSDLNWAIKERPDLVENFGGGKAGNFGLDTYLRTYVRDFMTARGVQEPAKGGMPVFQVPNAVVEKMAFDAAREGRLDLQGRPDALGLMYETVAKQGSGIRGALALDRVVSQPYNIKPNEPNAAGSRAAISVFDAALDAPGTAAGSMFGAGGPDTIELQLASYNQMPDVRSGAMRPDLVADEVGEELVAARNSGLDYTRRNDKIRRTNSIARAMMSGADKLSEDPLQTGQYALGGEFEQWLNVPENAAAVDSLTNEANAGILRSQAIAGRQGDSGYQDRGGVRGKRLAIVTEGGRVGIMPLEINPKQSSYDQVSWQVEGDENDMDGRNWGERGEQDRELQIDSGSDELTDLDGNEAEELRRAERAYQEYLGDNSTPEERARREVSAAEPFGGRTGEAREVFLAGKERVQKPRADTAWDQYNLELDRTRPEGSARNPVLDLGGAIQRLRNYAADREDYVQRGYGTFLQGPAYAPMRDVDVAGFASEGSVPRAPAGAGLNYYRTNLNPERRAALRSSIELSLGSGENYTRPLGGGRPGEVGEEDTPWRQAVGEPALVPDGPDAGRIDWENTQLGPIRELPGPNAEGFRNATRNYVVGRDVALAGVNPVISPVGGLRVLGDTRHTGLPQATADSVGGLQDARGFDDQFSDRNQRRAAEKPTPALAPIPSQEGRAATMDTPEMAAARSQHLGNYITKVARITHDKRGRQIGGHRVGRNASGMPEVTLAGTGSQYPEYTRPGDAILRAMARRGRA